MLTIADDVSSVSVRLDIRDSMIRLREFQQVRDVMVKVSRNELRPFLGFHEFGLERLEQLEVSGTWDTYQYNKWRNSCEKREQATKRLEP